MKIKEFFYLLGLRPRLRTYGIRVDTWTLARDGTIAVAQWLRPGTYRAVLETIDRLLRAQRPFLQVELFDLKKSDPDERARLYDFLVGHGYRIHRIESEARFLGEVVTLENLMSWRACDVFCLPKGYVGT